MLNVKIFRENLFSHSYLAVKICIYLSFLVGSLEIQHTSKKGLLIIILKSHSVPLMVHGLNVHWLPERQNKYSNIVSFLYGSDEDSNNLIFGKTLEITSFPHSSGIPSSVFLINCHQACVNKVGKFSIWQDMPCTFWASLII